MAKTGKTGRKRRRPTQHHDEGREARTINLFGVDYLDPDDIAAIIGWSRDHVLNECNRCGVSTIRRREGVLVLKDHFIKRVLRGEKNAPAAELKK